MAVPEPGDIDEQGDVVPQPSKPLEGLTAPVTATLPVPAKEPAAWQSSITPSGLEVQYRADPRAYRIRDRHAHGILTGETGWDEVASVTTVLGVLDKPALPWWGMKVGVAGVLELLDREVILSDEVERKVLVDAAGGVVDADDVVKFLTENRLTTNHVRDRAGARGTSVHDALEQWARFGNLPNPSDYPETEMGYVVALRDLLEKVPFEPQACEVMVGSQRHKFAGRYDLRAKLAAPASVVINNRRTIELAAGKYLLDLKTSSGVYPSHMLQLAAYELASQECGYGDTDHQLVVQVKDNGKFDLRLSPATGRDFLAVKDAYDALGRVKSGMSLRAAKP